MVSGQARGYLQFHSPKDHKYVRSEHSGVSTMVAQFLCRQRLSMTAIVVQNGRWASAQCHTAAKKSYQSWFGVLGFI